jgi:hypothetical protein
MELKKIIRQIITCIACIACALIAHAQVGIGTNSPHPSSALDVSFNNRGVLIPRVTLTGVNDNTTIPSPATSLLVYNTNAGMGGGGGAGFYYNAGTSGAPNWQRIASGTSTGNPWAITGNLGTNPTDNFVGTRDNQPLVFKTNNLQSGRLDPIFRSYFFGENAGINNAGFSNVGMGHNALRNNTNRGGLVALGDSTLYNNGSGASSSAHGTFNTAAGSRALRTNTTGSFNTALGARALLSNTSGSNNTAAGADALRQNTTGLRNSALGNGALQANTTGESNTAAGYFALNSNLTGSFNTAFGVYALEKNTASNNAALGTEALRNNTTGANNVGAGYLAAFSNTTGARNTAVGVQALEGTTAGQGSDLVAVGYRALGARGTGENNTAVGAQALEFVTGSGNTGIGYRAGQNIGAGSNNTAVGHLANISSGRTNSAAIGNGATVTASNTIRLGNTSVSSIGGQVAWSVLSDGRVKKDVQQNAPGLDFVLGLRPVSYFIDRQKAVELTMGSLYNAAIVGKMEPDNERHIGFIAQEVDALIKGKNLTFDVVDRSAENGEVFGLRYSLFVVPLINAVQEQQNQIDMLLQKVEKLKIALENKTSH